MARLAFDALIAALPVLFIIAAMSCLAMCLNSLPT
ncbi:hypothetical protein V22_19050 [Calycomorphotria hydatis]|uniref:Uncharacterized protein n=1 Tax=Calycomorphotria hydatis TaxID=2528027 RepID=A0A517T8F7_9PLAN|nr:hypothetical protein V22_19050 [Calycomorphotria hydatis]